MKSRFAVVLAPILFAAACASNEDPAEGGFISGVTGAATGGYQGRVDERQKKADALAEQDAELQQQKSEAALEIEQNEAEIAGLEAELSLLDFQIQDSLDRISNLDRALTDAERQTVNQAQQVAGSSTGTGASGTDARLESLKQSVLSARSLADQLAAIESG